MNQTITLTIGSKDFTFNVSTNDYNGYINDIMPNNKVAPAHNLVMRTVDESNKKELRELIDKSPGDCKLQVYCNRSSRQRLRSA